MAEKGMELLMDSIKEWEAIFNSITTGIEERQSAEKITAAILLLTHKIECLNKALSSDIRGIDLKIHPGEEQVTQEEQITALHLRLMPAGKVIALALDFAMQVRDQVQGKRVLSPEKGIG